MDVVIRAPSGTSRGAVPQPRGMSGVGGTDLYWALEWAANEAHSVNGRRGVIVFTDGQDSRGLESREPAAFERALSAVERSETPFYFVGIDTDLNPAARGAASNPLQKKARARMEELAHRSGGRIFFPRKIDDVVPLYTEIAHELGSLYTLGFAPVTADSNKYHRIEVRAKDTRLKLSQSRRGYNAADGDNRAVQTAGAAIPVTASSPVVTVAPPAVPAAPAAARTAPPAVTTTPAATPARSDNRSVLLGPTESAYAIPRGAAIYIAPGLSFESELRAAFQKKSVPLKIVMNKLDADFTLAGTSYWAIRRRIYLSIRLLLKPFWIRFGFADDDSVQLHLA